MVTRVWASRLLASLVITTLALPSVAAENKKGLIPELQIRPGDEDENQNKAVQSEVLITKTENQAINVLMGIIKKRKGSDQEPDLWYRLAELYMRRAKSGRFFDLYRTSSGAVRFAPSEVSGESARQSLQKAVQVYTKIEKEFPRFSEMDAVLFNNAFASQQLGMKSNAEALYLKVVGKYPRSILVPDSQLALGEMKYEAGKFSAALEHFLAIEKFPNSRVYSYGMYKSAWTYYNMRQNEDAVQKLTQVIKYHDPKSENGAKVNHNLRAEALRDLAIFFGDSYSADKAYSFFQKITNDDELGESLVNLGKLYLSHSRQKEMNIFLNEYIKKQEDAPNRLKAELLLVEANEQLRDRKEVIRHLTDIAAACQPKSDWVKNNTAIVDQTCNYDVSKVNLEIAKKWWDVWLKNKANKEMASLTEQAFKIHLDKEDPKKPDTKSRYAYAELLFQLAKYREASVQYEIVAKLTDDTKIKHDSDYGALVSLEKARDVKKEDKDAENIVRLANVYLQKNPKGEFVTQVKFKIGFEAYNADNDKEAEKWLVPLAKDTKAGEFKRKSEDLVLDIMNQRKDYAALQSFSKEIGKQTTDAKRKQDLTKIQQEAQYAEIQDFAKSGEKTTAAEKLFGFYKENKSAPLAKDSLWQALSLYYSAGRLIDGADLALVYAKDFPEDKRSLDALKEAAGHYSESGFLEKSAEVLQILAVKDSKDSEKYLEAASELYLLEGDKKQGRQTLQKLLVGKTQSQQAKIYTKILQTMKGEESSKEYQQLETKIAGFGVEPYASELRFRRVDALFKANKWPEAFKASMSLVGADGISEDVRAKARLIQAQILEKEFVETRTKTTVDRLALVLSIKTEKLDKAQTAFLSAAKIAKDPNIKFEALQGLGRIYTNYVDTVGHPELKGELSAEDKNALYAELGRLTGPILDKKIDIEKQLKKLAKDFNTAGTQVVQYEDLPVQETVKPTIPAVTADKLKVYYPSLSGVEVSGRFEPSKSDKCTTVSSKDIKDLSRMISVCVSQKKYQVAQDLAEHLVREYSKAPWGVFYMSLIASEQSNYDKALWLIDNALKKTPEISTLGYQKGRVLYLMGDMATANTEFLKASQAGLKSPEITLMAGIVSYAQDDCYSVVESLQKLDKKTIADLELAPVIGECMAQKGEFEKAVKYGEDLVSSYNNPVSLWLELARIQEIYRFDTAKAIQSYESALKTSKMPEQKDWIARKIKHMRGGTTTVGAAYDGQ